MEHHHWFICLIPSSIHPSFSFFRSKHELYSFILQGYWWLSLDLSQTVVLLFLLTNIQDYPILINLSIFKMFLCFLHMTHFFLMRYSCRGVSDLSNGLAWAISLVHLLQHLYLYLVQSWGLFLFLHESMQRLVSPNCVSLSFTV